MTALSLSYSSSAPMDATQVNPDQLWHTPLQVQLSGITRSLSITNFWGKNYPALNDHLMTHLLDIQPGDTVLDVGGGSSPFGRADVVTDAFPDNSAHRSGFGINIGGGKKFVQCFAEELPFENKEFDFAYCRAVLEHAVDPAAACKELMRVARRGFIETPSPITEYLGGHPTHRWLVYLENSPEQGQVLVFRRRPFVCAPFRYCLRGLWHSNLDYQFHNEWQFRNIACTQLVWDGEFAFRVDDDGTGFDYDDPQQAALSHLDTAMCGLRFGGIPSDILIADADIALGFRPDWALAHSVKGCILWGAGNYPSALESFREAARLEPSSAEFRHNARLRPGVDSPHLNIPPVPGEDTVLLENFAGKVYHAFVGYDEYLANDLNIKPGERVLDVGGGQRPLKRADVSIDLDVEDGLHRQGQIISREKPLVCGNVEQLPFADKAFDVVCCRMVLEHVIDPAQACRELQRVAKRGFLETPNLFWEAFYGHPTHRWVVSWEEPTRTLVFTRKPFERIPFKSAILPVLLTQRDVQHAFEVNYRNITATQIEWDEANPFHVRVDDDGTTAFDYLGNPEHATNANLHYVRDLLEQGVPQIAEAEEAIRDAPLPMQREEAIQLRMHIARAMGDHQRVQELQHLRQFGADPRNVPAASRGAFLWCAPLRDPSGYADEARHFLFALHQAGVPTAAREIRWSQKVTGLPREREQILNQIINAPVPSNAIMVSHILGSMLQRDPNVGVCVGRTMFETDRIPPDWVARCNQMDAVWVPSEFNRQTFAFAGVASDKLRVVPGAIDLAPYNPNCTPLQIDGARGFNFLSVFDWTLRKGWDALLRAFVEEFTPNDDVALIIKTHSSMGYSTEQMGGMIADFIENTLRRDLNSIPDIILQDTNVPDFRMPNLYRAADCYVMPSRGEGWGRPYMEAMAMGLPVIATNWSGQTAFLTPETALLLNYEVVDVPEAAYRETPTYQGHKWAEPSLAHLKTLMRQAFEDRNVGRETGLHARAHLEQNFTYEPVARILLAEYKRLQ
jgi:ubiquinone/menaquinone biosynthesis C-methylase UbiE/glycosyltransferase involved in cell wall biosynthesis